MVPLAMRDRGSFPAGVVPSDTQGGDVVDSDHVCSGHAIEAVSTIGGELDPDAFNMPAFGKEFVKRASS